MPHQCTNCGHTFADGSKEMLSGCPGCGGNTFQFHPKGAEIPEEPPADAESKPPEPEGGNAANTVGRAATKVRDFVGAGSESGTGTADSGSERPTEADPEPEPDAAPDPSAPWPDDLDEEREDAEIIDADARREADDAGDAEDLAQASARADVAGPDELVADAVDPSASGGTEPDTSGGSQGGATATGTDAPAPSDGRVVSEPSGEEPGIEELREQLNDQFESIKIVEPGQYELNLMELFDREEYIIALQENGRYVIQVPENWMGDRPGD
jgi:predicted  nucleic acid-binding Zn-ribbon protein